ncbi:MAG: hypothetical protein IJA20_08950 [Methanocorpusculum sp.]|nr:hypothetical protein [Methanocorpusculum sp.]
MPDSVDARLDSADIFFQNGNYSAAASELLEAVRLLSRDGKEIVSSISSEGFESPLFSAVRRVFSVFDTLPDSAELSVLMPEAAALLPEHAASPSEMLAAVSEIYEKAEAEAEEAAAGTADFSILQILLSLLSGQQSMRDILFSETGMYVSAASAAAPYLTGLLFISGGEAEASAEKADRLLFGPLKHLAELFYSLLTSSLTAGLLLLAVRRAIPVMRPSKSSAAAEVLMLAASNIPVLIAGLRGVAKELACLRAIIWGKEPDMETSNIV